MPKKYGADWPAEVDDLQIEMACIRRNGKWTSPAGVECGNGLAFHYEQMRKIIWPELDGEAEGQRWHVLIRDAILSHKISVTLGCGSSGKTHSAAWVYLCEWMCFPEETVVLVSSTDIRGLRLRIWGEITSLWERAIQRFDYLPGHLIDSKLAISATRLDVDGEWNDRKVRDLRQAIIGIPTIQSGKFVGLGKFIGIKQKRVRLIADEAQCFPAGTQINTPNGLRSIETLKSGDKVISAAGVDTILRVFRRRHPQLLRIRTVDNRQIVCTPSHPFFTQFGWVKACDLSQKHFMVSAHEAHATLEGLQAMQIQVRSALSEMPANFLQSILRREMASHAAGTPKEILHTGTQPQNSPLAKPDFQKRSTAVSEHDRQTERYHAALHGVIDSDSAGRAFQKAKQELKADWTQATVPRGKRDGADKSREETEKARAGIVIQRRGEDWNARRFGLSDLLQAGPRHSSLTVWCGGRRKLPSTVFAENRGCQENQISHGAWVDRVEVLQQENLERFRNSAGGIDVYNLEVENHPSYSVEGLLCHNCMGSGFLSAFSNLNKNEDFRATVIGNPNDILDPLGRAAEPADGWDGHMEPKQTETWKTRFMNGICVNLVGTDSPNNDFPGPNPRFRYLISADKIAETVSFFGKDSFEYFSQCVGVMKIGTLARRVLTRRICEQGNALTSDVIWASPERVKIYFVDAAYGGDRCVAGHGEFGKATNGQVILYLHEPKIIPISASGDKEPEQQIAEFVKADCEGLGIPPDCMGHDATGRGSLGTFIARVWSAQTHPIESGGQPTERPVSEDIFVTDPKTGVRRLKTCREHYIKLVTEYWFSVRYTVEARQLRNLNEAIMEEFCMRRWDLGTNDRRVLETKQEMKLRVGRSPDFADWAAGILEMARRKGFKIAKLANEPVTTNSVLSVLQKMSRERTQQLRSKDLDYAA